MNQDKTDLFVNGPVVINVGLLEFFESLAQQEVEAVHVDWRPPAAGDEELIHLLDELL